MGQNEYQNPHVLLTENNNLHPTKMVNNVNKQLGNKKIITFCVIKTYGVDELQMTGFAGET